MYAIVAHDAGAANHIFAWLRSGLINRDQSKLCLDGPALEIYRRSHPGFVNLTLEEVLSDTATVISGTGWASDLEHRARGQAAERNLLSIAVIDHWTNYTERFERQGKQIYPDQIWVSDEYAVTLCRQHFPTIDVVQQPNDLLALQLCELEAYRAAQQHAILFLMEPARDNWGHPSLAGEFQAFDFFAEHMELLTGSTDQSVVIKPHPSDPKGKYDHLLRQYPKLNLSIDTDSSLSALIASASTVVGCQTYAMVLALYSGKKVVSVLPEHAPVCALPQQEIIHLKELAK